MHSALRGIVAAAALVFTVGSAAQEGISPLPPNSGVARAAFTSQVIEGEPVDQVAVLTNNIREINYFTDLRGLAGRTVTHQWEHEGQVVGRISFGIEEPRRKVHSTRQLDPAATGHWTVLVLDEETGWPIHASTFRYDPVSP